MQADRKTAAAFYTVVNYEHKHLLFTI